jgi:hypothetical protein
MGGVAVVMPLKVKDKIVPAHTMKPYGGVEV